MKYSPHFCSTIQTREICETSPWGGGKSQRLHKIMKTQSPLTQGEPKNRGLQWKKIAPA